MEKKIKTIGLVVDTPNWAFANIARQIKIGLEAEGDFEVRIVALERFDNNPAKVLIALRDCDLVHFFWREAIRNLNAAPWVAYLSQLGLTFKEFEIRYLSNMKLTTSVYDHLFSSKEDLSRRASFFASIDGYTVSSGKLREIYSAHVGLAKPAAVIPDGVNLELFQPIDTQRFEDPIARKPVIGWVGNSEWGGNGDHKGLETVIKPALKLLEKSGITTVSKFADRKTGFIAQEEMPEYYASIDVLVCASLNEGTPNPVLEAMACGVPVVTTDVGVVRDAFGTLQQNYILGSRTPEALAQNLEQLFRLPGERRRLSEENQHSIQGWSWDIQVTKFREFFEEILF